ncbi:MAG: deoxynucleoside kinase [Ilumatobacter sp.]|uniref:deoxynucleoside kinase n=1 Tax=Ilumatobacter sp. TaxID=1967498 RepID=UPI0032997F05
MSIVAIDGPTGVGKSTTTRRLGASLGCPLLLDPVSVNPLLDDYYTGEAAPAAALAVELAFLRSRAELLAAAPTDQLTVADFSVMRTAPFSEFLDAESDRRTVLDEMRGWIARGPRLDVLVLLRAEPRELLTRVRDRDRAAESDLTIEHLVALRTHFDTWHDQMCAQADTVIEIDTSRWDPRDDSDLGALIVDVRAALDP